MEMRPPSRMRRLSTKPSPGLPSSCDTGKRQLAGGAGAHAELVFLLADAESGDVFFDKKGGDAVLRRGAIRDGHSNHDVGILRVGDEILGAIQDPALAVLDGFGAHGAGVGAGLGFGERPASDPFAGGQFWNVLGALFVVAGEINMISAERIVRGHDESDGRIDARELFDDDGVIDVAESGAAELFRENGS